MPEVFCNTSPFQYLHQTRLLHVLPALAGRVIVPPAVRDELTAGRRAGHDVPELAALDWVSVREPSSLRALPLVTDLGPGETGVLMLALESSEPVVILDDGRARRMARVLGLPLTGTLGILLDAKRAGLVPAITPILDELQQRRFRLAPETRQAVLKMAGEASRSSG